MRGSDGPVAQMATMTGTDVATYIRERPGMSAFVLEDGVVYHTYSAYARGLDGLWGMYQWLDRAPLGRNESGIWWRRHDEYRRALKARIEDSYERDADARWLDDVDGVDADAWPDVARRRSVLSRHVDRHDGGDDAAVADPDAATLSPGRRPDRRRCASPG